MATKQQIEAAKDILSKSWENSGACASCGWHALLTEHEIDDEIIEEALDDYNGILKLTCQSKDCEGDERHYHRGVEINLISGDV